MTTEEEADEKRNDLLGKLSILRVGMVGSFGVLPRDLSDTFEQVAYYIREEKIKTWK